VFPGRVGGLHQGSAILGLRHKRGLPAALREHSLNNIWAFRAASRPGMPKNGSDDAPGRPQGAPGETNVIRARIPALVGVRLLHCTWVVKKWFWGRSEIADLGSMGGPGGPRWPLKSWPPDEGLGPWVAHLNCDTVVKSRGRPDSAPGSRT
jgi:hypothetical protein